MFGKMGIRRVKMNNWRPDGWAKILLRHMRKRLDEASPENTSIEWSMLNCAEAGADAMLEGLKKEAIHVRTKWGWRYLRDSYDAWLHGDKVGYIVFIPEEADEEED